MPSPPQEPHRPGLVPDILNPVKRIRVMGRFVRRQLKKPGSAPGTLVHTGPQHMERVRITFLDYVLEELREREVESLESVLPLRDSPTVTWVNVDGLHDVDLVERFGEHFGIHRLVLEDILRVGQRPKAEIHDGYIYVVLFMLHWDEEHEQVREEQVSLILGPRWVFSFQERIGDVFEPVRERIRTSNRLIRRKGSDYLGYALVDAVVDGYYAVLERVGELTEELEIEVLDDPSQDTMHRLHHLKRELLALRRAVAPLRDLTNVLIRDETLLVAEDTTVFLRDVQDHAVQMVESVETLRDVVTGLIDLYISQMGQRTNEVMKVLTIMASIFIPLTFVAGVYGMNFEHMPELAWPWAYPAVLGVMAGVGVGMVVYFRRKGWF